MASSACEHVKVLKRGSWEVQKSKSQKWGSREVGKRRIHLLLHRFLAYELSSYIWLSKIMKTRINQSSLTVQFRRN